MSASAFKVSVFTVPSRAVVRPSVPPPPPGGWTWPPNTATLISGERDAILVDALTTIDEAESLADWIEATGKNLKMIYITHGHGDHLLGAPVLLRRFPWARLVALPAAVEELGAMLKTDAVKEYWKPMFSGEIVEEQLVPEALPDGRLDLEGHMITAVQTGQSDTEHSTYVHIPELATVIAGDIAYNGVYPHIGATDHAKRLSWIVTLREIAALNPRVVIASHRRPDAPDTPDVLTETIRYIEDADRILASGATMKDFIQQMATLHGNRQNVTTLYFSAYQLASDSPLKKVAADKG